MELGCAIGKKGIDLIYGGASIGLMGCVARGVHEEKGNVIGILPEFFRSKDIEYLDADELIVTKDMRERKAKMDEKSDAFIVLPGGVGSMDELLEVMVSNQLGGINKPVGLLNINGYFDGFLSWLQHSVDEEFVSLENQNQILVNHDPQELLGMILSAQMPSSDTWIERLNVDFSKIPKD